MGSKANAKLAGEEVIEIRRPRDEGVPKGELASRFRVTRENSVLAASSRFPSDDRPDAARLLE